MLPPRAERGRAMTPRDRQPRRTGLPLWSARGVAITGMMRASIPLRRAQQQLLRALARCDSRWVRVLTWWRVHKNIRIRPCFLLLSALHVCNPMKKIDLRLPLGSHTLDARGSIRGRAEWYTRDRTILRGCQGARRTRTIFLTQAGLRYTFFCWRKRRSDPGGTPSKRRMRV